MNFCNRSTINIIKNNAKTKIKIEKLLKINKGMNERKRNNMPAIKNLFFINSFVFLPGILTFILPYLIMQKRRKNTI